MYIIDLKTFKLPKDFPKKGELKRLLIQQTVDLHDEDIKQTIENVLYDSFRPFMSSRHADELAKDGRKRIINSIEHDVNRRF
jgi:hypothetical protein